MHLFRQQFPLNFFPYGPYLPPFCMPQPYIHQFVSPNGYQQQSYLPPGDDALPPSGVKLPLTHIKSGSDIGNYPPTTIPSPYDSYAFNHFPSAATVTSTHKEEKKENNYATGPLVSLSLPPPLSHCMLCYNFLTGLSVCIGWAECSQSAGQSHVQRTPSRSTISFPDHAGWVHGNVPTNTSHTGACYYICEDWTHRTLTHN